MSLITLPVEVITMIAEHISTPHDVKNLTDVLPHLDNLLLPILQASVQEYYAEPTLSWAAFRGYSSLVTRLLDHGVDIDAKTENCEYPWHAALMGCSRDFTALSKAAINGKLDVVRILMEYGCNRNVQVISNAHFQCSGTALHCAAFYKQESVVRFLLNAGADPNHRNGHGQTALHLVVGYFEQSEGGYDIARLLLERGADVNAQDLCGRTALHMAVAKYAEKTPAPTIRFCLLLLNANIGIDTQDVWGRTVLHYAVIEGGLEEVVEFLIGQGCDRSIKDNDELTAFEML